MFSQNKNQLKNLKNQFKKNKNHLNNQVKFKNQLYKANIMSLIHITNNIRKFKRAFKKVFKKQTITVHLKIVLKKTFKIVNKKVITIL